MEDISTTTILISITTSIFGGLIVAYLLKYRDNKIKQQIEELDSHEEYLEKLSKGNIKLLRSSLGLLFVLLFLFSFAAITFLINTTFDLNPMIELSLFSLSISALAICAALCFYQAQAIGQSGDLRSAKEKIQKKRDKLVSKIT
jgi:H+/gluconate symporter-like permease